MRYLQGCNYKRVSVDTEPEVRNTSVTSATDVRILHGMTDPNWTAVRDAIAARLDQLGWSKAELARQSGVDADTIGALLNGSREPRPSTRRRLSRPLWGDEEAINKVLAGSPPAAVMLQDVHPPSDDPPPTDFRSGAGTLDADEQAGLRALEQQNTAILTVGRSLGRLGLDPVDDPGLDPPADVVVDHDGTRTVIQVAGRLGHDISQDITDMVGEQARWRADGVDRVIVFAYVDWPEPVVEEINRFGIEYAGSQDELEQLLTAEGKG